MKGQGYVILAIILTIIIAIFAVINIEPVEVNYLFWSATSPLILVILFSVLMGGIITAIAGMMKIFQMRKQITNYQKVTQELQTMLEKQGVPPSKIQRVISPKEPKKELKEKN